MNERLAEALILLATAAVAGLGLRASSRWPRRSGGPGLVDVALAVLALLWGSAWGSLAGLCAMGIPWTSAAEVPMIANVAGTAAGGAAAAAVAVARVGPRGLGLGAPPLRWIAFALLLLPPFLGVSALWAALLEALRGPVAEQQILGLVREQWGSSAGDFVVAFALLGAPVFEEVLFRGLGLPAFARHIGRPAALVCTALVFGALHGADPDAVPPLVVLGLLLGWLRQRSGSLWPCVALHVANNSLVLWSLAAGG